MNATLHTMADLIETTNEIAYTTQRPLSRARFEGTIWAEQLLSQARACAADADRFLKGMDQ